jgi:hypothetical protein
MKAYLKLPFTLSVLVVFYGCVSSTAPQFSQEINQAEANFILYVSNQSFDKPKVDISIIIDGKSFVNDTFPCNNQHYWKIYALKLPTGNHVLKATADSGEYKFEKDFKITNKHWAALTFWYKKSRNKNSKTSGLNLDISDKPYGFL